MVAAASLTLPTAVTNVETAYGIPEAIPSGLTAVAVSQTQINVSWTAVPGATSYELERDGSVIASQAGTTYSDTGLGVGTAHTYRVRAVETT
jgi:hypothetical protein